MVRRVLNVMRAGMLGDKTDQTFIPCEARNLDRFLLQAFIGEEFKVAIFKPEVNRANIGNKRAGNEINNARQTAIKTTTFCHKRPEPRHKNARGNSAYRARRPVRWGHQLLKFCPQLSASSPYAVCRARTASSVYDESIRTEILISDVEMT